MQEKCARKMSGKNARENAREKCEGKLFRGGQMRISYWLASGYGLGVHFDFIPVHKGEGGGGGAAANFQLKVLLSDFT